MNHLNVIAVILIVSCVAFTACDTQNNTGTFSGRLIDVNGKPIAGHIVTLYPIEMSEDGSAIYQPLMAIATSPGFLTARTDRNGVFTFTDDINPGMIRLGLIPSKTLDKIRKSDLKESGIKLEYSLVSVKMGVMTFYADGHGSDSTTFSLQPEQKI